MVQRLMVLLLFCFWQGAALAQGSNPYPANDVRLRISLITCGPGYDEVWEVFGHTAVRIIDSSDNSDLVYNYGTFNGFDENFELNFMRGKLLYYLSVYPFSDFMQEYIQNHRSITEQVVNLDSKSKEDIAAYLYWNAEPANREYKYDFFFDNCATRIREIFPHATGKNFVLGQALPAQSRLTFRDIINQYFYCTPWVRMGVNILLGSKIDKVMDNKDIMFLPDYLSIGLAKSTLRGKPVMAPPALLLDGSQPVPQGPNLPLLLTGSVCLLTVLGLSVRRLRLLGRIMTALLLTVTGLLGCLILVMWLATDHQGCSNNYNVLWALPTNLIIAFANPKGKGRYALIAMFLVFVTLILHITGVQQLPLTEFLPLLLSLLFIYGTIYRSQNSKTAVVNA